MNQTAGWKGPYVVWSRQLHRRSDEELHAGESLYMLRLSSFYSAHRHGAYRHLMTSMMWRCWNG
jgi:hypothetical protein